MWQCSNCGRPIFDHAEGYLIADDNLTNWRVVHRVSCDPDTGPWHPLAMFIGKQGIQNFRSLAKIGAFNALSHDEREALRRTVVREEYQSERVQRTPFRQWLHKQEHRDDPIGDLARDMRRDPGQVKPNPSLNDLYGYLRAMGVDHVVLGVLVEAYREWQSYGNTYRETRAHHMKPVPNVHKPRPVAPIKPIEQRPGWLALRFRVLKRDHYRCQICGRTAADGVTLEVDHKIPRAKGGTDDPANLWTLCFDCNRGKRDSDL